MASVNEITTPRKAPKAFFAHLYDAAGVLAKVEGDLMFFGDDGDIITVEPSMINYLAVLGELGIAECQQLMDRMHGGAAQIACSRQMEVA